MAPIREDRRGGNDGLLRAIRWLAGLGWLALFGTLFFLDRAHPRMETLFDRYYHIALRPAWDLALARYIFYLMVLGLVLSLTGLVLNLVRYRRRDDEIRLSLALIAIISLAGIIKYWLSF
jgi:hypothetical protein